MRLTPFVAFLFALYTPSAAAQASWTSSTGRVTDAETGDPVPGATVELLVCDAADRPATCRLSRWSSAGATDAHGAFRIWSAMARVYAVRVTHPDYVAERGPPYDEAERLRRNREDLASTEGPPSFEIALRPRRGGCAPHGGGTG